VCQIKRDGTSSVPVAADSFCPVSGDLTQSQSTRRIRWLFQ
jgi:hypothetical protein